MDGTMTCDSKRVIKEEIEYERLRHHKIEANIRKLESLGLLALATAVKPVIDLKR